MGAVFAIFAGVTWGYPVFSGVTIPENYLKLHFFIIFVGVNLTFFPQHFLGLQGIPRRYSDYPDSIAAWNIVSSSGSLIRIIGVIIFAGMIWQSVVSKGGLLFFANRNIEYAPRIPTS